MEGRDRIEYGWGKGGHGMEERHEVGFVGHGMGGRCLWARGGKESLLFFCETITISRLYCIEKLGWVSVAVYRLLLTVVQIRPYKLRPSVPPKHYLYLSLHIKGYAFLSFSFSVCHCYNSCWGTHGEHYRGIQGLHVPHSTRPCWWRGMKCSLSLCQNNAHWP